MMFLVEDAAITARTVMVLVDHDYFDVLVDIFWDEILGPVHMTLIADVGVRCLFSLSFIVFRKVARVVPDHNLMGI